MAAAVCIGLLIAIPIGLLIGAAILRGAISLANMCIGGESYESRSSYDDDDLDYRPRRSASSSKVPEPSLGQAMMIILVTAIVNAVVGFGVGIVVGVAGAGANMDQQSIQIIAQLIGLPVGFLIMSGMLTALLPTSFGRACLVTLFYYLICIAIGIAIVAVVFVAAGGFK